MYVVSQLLGGTGLFLVGMILLSEGLKAAAGGHLQRILEHSTRTPTIAFLSGMGMTALVQSSSATTLATIGFVSAGLLSFSSAIGVVIGSNVGTTSTGWIVSTLGFKLDVGAMALPLIGVGALIRLLASGRRAHLGMALVGFGLIFVGIDFLQSGMGGVADQIDFSGFLAERIAGRLALVLIGAAMTVLLQSSSAAVAITLAALHAGTIGLDQAAFLVIGQNLGTTVKAALAAIGASIPARRTAVAHILFNVMTAALAFAGAGLLLSVSGIMLGAAGETDAAVQIALFHTLFNVLGAFVLLPFVAPFSRFVARMIPDRGPALTRHLDRSLLSVPAVAVETTARALHETLVVTLEEVVRLLMDGQRNARDQELLRAAQEALQEVSGFIASVPESSDETGLYTRRLALLHAADHAARLIQAGLEFEGPVQGPDAPRAAERLLPMLREATRWLRSGDDDEAADVVRNAAETSARQAENRRSHRARLLEETAAGRLRPDEAQRHLESMRWVDRVAYHTWRTLHHLAGMPSTGRASEVYEDVETDDPARHVSEKDNAVPR